jgi:apolipoprotein N-acyltransferase
VIAAFLAGAATVPAFAPVGVYPVALASLCLLINFLGEAQGWRAFRISFAFAVGMFLAGVSWVYVSLHDFGGMPAPLAAIATLLFCALLALFFALGGWLQARLPAADALRACLLIPAAWTLAEWSLSWVFTGFPWLALGYAAAGWPTQGYAPLLGVFGISFITVSLAGLVWLIFKSKREIVPKILPITAILITVGAGEALRRVDWSTPAGEPVSAALLQGNVGQELKFRPERYAQILETYARLAEGTKARLIVLPETAVPRFLDQIDPAYLARLAALARRNGGDLLLGAPLRAAPGEYYNSVVSLGTSPPQVYHKSHLLPFGEFIPPGFGWVLRILDIPLADFARGPPGQPPLAVAGQRVAVNVCYEDAFGDEIRRRAPPATLLVNVSNVAWFGDSLAPAQHLQIARLRAIENGRMYLSATNTGVTAAIDRDGRVIARLPQFVEGRLEIAAQGYAGLTPYMRFGDWPIVALSLAALLGAAVIARRRLRR